MSIMDEKWAGLGSTIASLMFMWAVVRQYFPHQLENYFGRYTSKFMRLVYPYISITFSEYVGERLKRSEAYTAVESYLSATCSERAKNLKAEIGKDSTKLVLSLGDHEEVTDVFKGVALRWRISKTTSKAPTFSFYSVSEDKRYYRLTFHKQHKQLINDFYLSHVLEEGRAIAVRKRQRKLFTNSASRDPYSYRKSSWSHVPFVHPASFDTIAMDKKKKQEIVQDLQAFSRSKDYYAKIGKPWKRGYLLYGPPGTGKSTMVAAMANLLDYDVYDLELTAVKDNSTLRKLLIETTSKSIILIEDIDCSLDLTGKRKKGTDKKSDEDDKSKPPSDKEDKEESKVTLSGLLNFIDGLWSACVGERLVVVTTNHIKELDPALIRRGRMDKHIELSYCSFEAFKALAGNYLNIYSHPLFGNISQLLEEVSISPADVGECLMPKAELGTASVDVVNTCLEELIKALNDAKHKKALEAAEVAEAAGVAEAVEVVEVVTPTTLQGDDG